MQSVAYRSIFHNTPGVALRDPAGRVHFADDATGVWRALTNADAPALTLLGRLDLIETQRMQDARFGSLYALIDDRNTEHVRVAA